MRHGIPSLGAVGVPVCEEVRTCVATVLRLMYRAGMSRLMLDGARRRSHLELASRQLAVYSGVAGSAGPFPGCVRRPPGAMPRARP